MDGIIVVNKPKGITSRDVVNKACKLLNTKKIGHTGTLDPIATGVLVLCVGKATKLVEVLKKNDKEYIATVKLGVLTDTLDTDGKVLEEKVILLKRNECDITTTKALDMISDSDFKCLSDYDFNDLDNNTTLHNDLVVSYTRSTFDSPVVRELEKEYTSSLRSELHDLRRNAKSVKNMLSDRIKSVEGLERLCQEKLKQL